MQFMLDRGISTRRSVMLIHTEQAYNNFEQSSLPVTEKINARSLILPLYIGMTEDDVAFICQQLKAYLG